MDSSLVLCNTQHTTSLQPCTNWRAIINSGAGRALWISIPILAVAMAAIDTWIIKINRHPTVSPGPLFLVWVDDPLTQQSSRADCASSNLSPLCNNKLLQQVSRLRVLFHFSSITWLSYFKLTTWLPAGLNHSFWSIHILLFLLYHKLVRLDK